MKISRRELRQIIKEEISLSGMMYSFRDTAGRIKDTAFEMGDAAMDSVVKQVYEATSLLSVPAIEFIKLSFDLNADLIDWLTGEIQIDELGEEIVNHFNSLPGAVADEIQGLRDNIAGMIGLFPITVVVKSLKAALETL